MGDFWKRYELVCVQWTDASRLNDGWMDLSDIPPPYLHRCVTVGFVIGENKDGIILVPTIGDTEHIENSHTYGGMMIPRHAILSRKRLR